MAILLYAAYSVILFIFLAATGELYINSKKHFYFLPKYTIIEISS